MKKPILILAMVAGLFLKCNFDYHKENFNELKKAHLTFSNLNVNGKTISPEQLLKQVKGKEKEGFIIKSIAVNEDEIAEVEGTKPYLKLNIKKAGTFKITLVLEKKGFEDVTIEGEITIEKVTATFKKFTGDGNKIITTAQILAQIQGLTGLNYTIKNITISDATKAEIQGTKPYLKLNIKKAGTFTATITLEKNGFLDIPLNNCEFEISNNALTFSKLTRTDGNKTITTAQILLKVGGNKAGYFIKSITISDGGRDKAEVLGTKPFFSIKIKQAGTFTSNIVLEKSGHSDVNLNNCEFEISNAALTFPKLTRTDGPRNNYNRPNFSTNTRPYRTKLYIKKYHNKRRGQIQGRSRRQKNPIFLLK